MDNGEIKSILITGASGYIGGRLLKELVSKGFNIRCMARNPKALAARISKQIDVVEGDVLNPDTLASALEGIHTVYYNIHSLGGSKDFSEQDRIGAQNFVHAAEEAGVKKIVYLGGLGKKPGLSKHLASRQEVGEILGSGTVPCIEFRASIIIGSGSLSFEMVRSLVEKLPVMTTPRWVRTLAQPIAIEDVIRFLLGALSYTASGHEVFEIGGADRISYEGIMRIYAEIRHLKRLIIPIHFLTPGLSSKWLALVTPLYAKIGRWLIDGVQNETVVTNNAAQEIFSVQPMGITEAVKRALENEDLETAATRWSDSFGSYFAGGRWGGERSGSRLVYSKSIRIPVPPEEAFLPIQYIGGQTGWYSYPWMWTIRGTIDKIVGGAGGNRGRRDPIILLPGDVVDFWRVEDIEQYRMLRLRSEMKAPGRGWLQFETNEVTADYDAKETVLSIHAIFEPLGLRGLLYWYLLYPFHLLIFGKMLREIYNATCPPLQRRGDR